MELKRKLMMAFNSAPMTNTRAVLGELAVGLSISWALLFLLEILRSGLVSLYLDLNLILAITILSWLTGARPRQ